MKPEKSQNNGMPEMLSQGFFSPHIYSSVQHTKWLKESPAARPRLEYTILFSIVMPTDSCNAKIEISNETQASHIFFFALLALCWGTMILLALLPKKW